MENENQIPLGQTLPQVPVKPSTNWLKIIVFIFLGLLVIVGAVFVGIQIGKKYPISNQPKPFPIQTVVNPTDIPVKLSPTINPISDWKTYANNKLGVSFKYPSNWQIIENSGIPVLYPPESNPELPSANASFYILDTPFLPEPTPEKCTTEYKEYDINDILGRTNEDISTSSSSPCFRVGGCLYRFFVEIPINNKTLVGSACKELETDFKAILQTLKIQN